MTKCTSEKTRLQFKYELLREEYEKLLILPDKEFLSPEVTHKLDTLRDEMLTIIKKLNEPSRTSKYFDKHYKIEKADLYERQCYHCKKIFGIDYKWIKYVTRDCDPDWAECTCPYCGTKLHWHI